MNEISISKIKKDKVRLITAMQALLDDKLWQINNCHNKIVDALQGDVERKQSTLLLNANKLAMLDTNIYQEKLNNINLKLNTLNNLNPAQVLMKGYAQLYSSTGQVIKTKNQLKVDDEIDIVLVDGKVKSKIIEV